MGLSDTTYGVTKSPRVYVDNFLQEPPLLPRRLIDLIFSFFAAVANILPSWPPPIIPRLIAVILTRLFFYRSGLFVSPKI